MLNSQKTGLRIFDEFAIDYQLPKHKNGSNISSNLMLVGGIAQGNQFISPADFVASAGIGGRPDGPRPRKSVFKKIFEFIFGKTKSAKPKISVKDFFLAVKKSAINIEDYSCRVNDFMAAIDHAKSMNQEALVQKLTGLVDQAKNESLLFASELKTVITEEQIVKFYKESPKGLRLTWIRQFTRIIPSMVKQAKDKADEINVFDNYVILHYDPDKKSYMEEMKDPILFGVISGSRKLYYIADWIDEYCDLTLETFIEKFGKDVISANDISAKFKIEQQD